MDNPNLIIKFCCKGLKNKSSEFVDRIINYAFELSKRFEYDNLNYMSYNILELEKYKLKTFNDKVTSLSIESLKNKFQTKGFKGFEIGILENTWKIKSRDTKLSVSYINSDEIFKFHTIILQLEFSIVKTQKEIDKLFSNFLNLLNELFDEIIYGLLLKMDKKKYPKFFIEGINSKELDKEEIEIANKWMNGKLKCDLMVWDIFHWNFFSIKHFPNGVIKNDDLEISIINEKNILIKLPDKCLNNEKEYIKYRDLLRKFFRDNNRLM